METHWIVEIILRSLATWLVLAFVAYIPLWICLVLSENSPPQLAASKKTFKKMLDLDNRLGILLTRVSHQTVHGDWNTEERAFWDNKIQELSQSIEEHGEDAAYEPPITLYDKLEFICGSIILACSVVSATYLTFN